MSSFFKHLGMVAFALLPILSSAALQTGKVQVGKVSGTVTLIDAKAQRKPLAIGTTSRKAPSSRPASIPPLNSCSPTALPSSSRRTP